MSRRQICGALGGFIRLSDLVAWLDCPCAILIQRCRVAGIELLTVARGSQCCIAVTDLRKLMRPLDHLEVHALISEEDARMERQWLAVRSVWLLARQRFTQVRIPYAWFIVFIRTHVSFHQNKERGWRRVRPQQVWPILERHLDELRHR